MKENYLKKALENLQELNEYNIALEDESKGLSKGDSILLDLGNHYVGYFSFNMECYDAYIDAPVRLNIKFLETKREIEDNFSTYKGGLCPSWLQEEVVNIDYPGIYKMPRRYAARYIKITVIAASQKINLSGFNFKSVTSADIDKLKSCEIKDDELKKIDIVSVNTLKNCMHRVFEDGPKRDRRLWIGDLRLEALTNYYTFNNLSLVKRCLYLFAAATVNNKGFLPGYIYEYPKYVSGSWHLLDYALLFVVTACDYFNHTDDKKTFMDLYPVIKEQMNAMENTIDDEGVVTVPDGCEAFIDWCKGLEKITALHGVYMYTLKALSEVLNKLSHPDAEAYEKRYERVHKSSIEVLYDREKNAFINKKDNFQFSVHSAVWMILGGAVEGENARKILSDALISKESVKPFTPYFHHYVLEAMIKIGMTDKAFSYMKNYWGEMVKQGADTFYEAFVPDDPEFSPYSDRMMNSMCHAWSCTPSYFIRKLSPEFHN